jgi:hypothetical protein
MEVFKKKIIITFFVLFSITAYTQSKLVVYQVKGNVKLKQTNKQLYTGGLLHTNSTIIVNNGSAIILDENSNMYKVFEDGIFNFNDIKKKKLVSNSKSVSKRYLSYVYKKFLNKEEKKSIYGGVFRGNSILNSPDNFSYYTSNSFVAFNWKSTGEKEFYVWILNAKNNKIVGKYKLEYANSLSLLLPFKKGVYKWTVTTENTLENIKGFNLFEIVKQKEFDKREKDLLYKVKKKIELMI